MKKPVSETWRYPSASVVAELDRGISHLHVSGVFTPSTAALMSQDNAAWLSRIGAVGQVACYRRAALAIGADQLLAAALKSPAFALPTALLVDRAHFGLITEFAMLMAQRGICRAPFVDPDQAARWTSRQAEAVAELRSPPPAGRTPWPRSTPAPAPCRAGLTRTR